MPVFISKKFTDGAVCKFNDTELLYGEEAFSSIADAQAYVGGNTVILIDDNMILSVEDSAILNTAYAISSTGYFEEDATFIIGTPETEFSNVKAANSITINDLQSNSLCYAMNFLTVTVNDTNASNLVFEKDNYFTSKEKNHIETRSFSHNGTISVNNSVINEIREYLNVNLTNSSVNNIIRDTRTQEKLNSEYTIGEIYAANGTLNITIDESAIDENYYINSISGYNTVNINGCEFATLSITDTIIGGKIISYDGVGEYTYSTSGTFSATDNISLNNIKYFANVTLDNITANNIENAFDGTASQKESVKKIGKNEDAYYQKTITSTYKKTGAISITNSSVGDIYDYKTVKLLNSDAGNIDLSSISKQVEIRTTQDKNFEYPENTSITQTLTADGALTIKLDENAINDCYTITSIEGYKTVNISGYTTVDGIKKTVTVGYIEGGNGIISTESDSSDEITTSIAAGSITLNENAIVNGNINGFNTVSINNSQVLAVDRGNNTEKVKIVHKTKTIKDEMNADGKYTLHTTTATKTYTLDGKLTLSGSAADICNYKTISITNGSAGMISLANMTKAVYEWNYEYEDEYADKTSDTASSIKETYTANGSFTAKLDNKANNENSYSLGNISGYKTVNISGYIDKNDPDNSVSYMLTGITGGNKTVETKRNNSNTVTDTTYSAAGSLTLNNTTTGGNAEGFATVKISNTQIGDIDKFADKVKSTKSKNRKSESSSGYYIKQKEVTVTYDKSGTLTVDNSSIGNAQNYKTVTLTNSSAASVTRDTLDKYITYEDIYDDYESDWKQFLKQFSSDGSFTAKLNSKANKENSYSLGNISGYKTVNISGCLDKNSAEASIFYNAGDITGGKKYEAGEISNGSESRYSDMEPENTAFGTIKLNAVQAKNINNYASVSIANSSASNIIAAQYTDWDSNRHYYGSGKRSNSYKYSNNGETQKTVETFKAADKVTIDNSTIDNIYGYKKVTVSGKSEIAGDINIGTAYSSTFNRKTTYDRDWNEFNVVSYSYKKTAGTLTVSDSIVNNVSGYSKVTVTNSTINGNVTLDILNKITGSLNTKKNIDKLSYEYKASGSFTFTVNKKAYDNMYYIQNNISGYDKVSISGYTDKSGNKKSVIVNGNICGGTYYREGSMENYIWSSDFIPASADSNDITKYKASGSITIKNNVTVENIYAYDKITIENSTVSGGILNKNPIDYAGTVAAGSSVGLTDSTVTSIEGYKKITLKNSNVLSIVSSSAVNVKKGISSISSYYTENDITGNLSIDKGATLKADTITLNNGKATINGTLVVTSAFYAKSISGKGEIAATQSLYESFVNELPNSKVKLVNLGNTDVNFISSTAEKADNTAKKAAKWDSLDDYNGWLCGSNVENGITDTVDYIKFKAAATGQIIISGAFGESDKVICDSSTLSFNGSECRLNVMAGTTYTIGIQRNEENSVSYTMSLLTA